MATYIKTITDKLGNMIAPRTRSEAVYHGDDLLIESGEWTPQVRFTTTAGVITYTYQQGYYTRVGNLVKCNFFIRFQQSNGDGLLEVFELPLVPISPREIGVCRANIPGSTGKGLSTLNTGGSNPQYLRVGDYMGNNATHLTVGTLTIDMYGSITYEV